MARYNGRVLPLSVTLLLLVFGLLMVVMRSRRRVAQKKFDEPGYDFEISELHRLRLAGQISAEEFERAKSSILSRRPVGEDGKSGPGFEVLPPRKPMIQSLEDRIAP